MSWSIIRTLFPGVHLLKTDVHLDARGSTSELYDRAAFEALGLRADLSHALVSTSQHGVIRGLHYQSPNQQTKIVSVISGAIFDLVVDVRVNSPTFGESRSMELAAQSGERLWIGPGFAHGYQVLTPEAVVCYQCTAYDPLSTRTIAHDGRSLNIWWPLPNPMLSLGDATAPSLEDLRVKAKPHDA